MEKYISGIFFLHAPSIFSICFLNKYCFYLKVQQRDWTTQTFWATWLTQWEVQLLRSGPFGFQVPLERTHKYEAVPGRKTRKVQLRKAQDKYTDMNKTNSCANQAFTYNMQIHVC